MITTLRPFLFAVRQRTPGFPVRVRRTVIPYQRQVMMTPAASCPKQAAISSGLVATISVTSYFLKRSSDAEQNNELG